MGNSKCTASGSLSEYIVVMAAVFFAAFFISTAQAATTTVGIQGESFTINGVFTNPASAAEGLLINLRAPQGAFDDETTSTKDYWAGQPGDWSTADGVWDADDIEHNLNEFLLALEEWSSYGMNAVTVGMMGGNPNPDSDAGKGPTYDDRKFGSGSGNHTWERVSAFDNQGGIITIKPEWKDRLEQIIEKADQEGIVVILNTFYKYQSDVFDNEAQVFDALEAAIDWLLGEKGYTNVILDLVNESSASYFYSDGSSARDIFDARNGRATRLIDHAHNYVAANYPGQELLVSFSHFAVRNPDFAGLSQYFDKADFVLWHGNGIDMATQEDYINTMRSRAPGKPIVWNEDNWSEADVCPNRMTDAMNQKGQPTVDLGVGWGFYWKGCGHYDANQSLTGYGYTLGYQAMPVNYRNSANDPFKQEFLNWVASVTNTTLDSQPVADAGPDQTISNDDNSGIETVALDGATSFDPDGGSITSYEWLLGTSTIGNTATMTIDLTVGVHTVTLIVTDDEAAIGTDDVVITINPNQPPTANAGLSQTIMDSDNNGSEGVTLDGSSSFDTDGIISMYEWMENTVLLGTTTAVQYDFPVGTHMVMLTVTDNGGATSTDLASITVEPYANQAPIADAGADQGLSDTDGSGEEAVTLDSSGSFDIDGTIVSYEWTEGTTTLATTATATLSFFVGDHTVSLEVADDAGATSTDVVIIAVGANQPPTANAGSDKAADVNEVAFFDGTGSTDDGAIISYEWDFGDGATSTGVTTTHTYGAVGVYTAALAVTDNGGLVSQDSAVIDVTNTKTDVVVIINASYHTKKGRLMVDAGSSMSGEAVLTVEGYGIMDYDPSRDRYRLMVNGVESSPWTVTVTSSFGGSDTANVIIRGR